MSYPIQYTYFTKSIFIHHGKECVRREIFFVENLFGGKKIIILILPQDDRHYSAVKCLLVFGN